MLDVTALGELLIDATMQSADKDGYPTLAAHPGGAPANFLSALSHFGKKTAFIGKVGDDVFGNLLINTLKSENIGTSGIRRSDKFFTTMAFVTLDNTGNRHFSFARKPGADTMLTFDECDLSLIDKARVFHFGTLSLTAEPVRTTTKRVVAYAKQKGKLISFDPNLRLPLWDSPSEARSEILWGLSNADIVKISDEEVVFLWNCSPDDGAKKLLREFNVRLVFVTKGASGCLYANGASVGAVPCPNVQPIDTTGAGDIFGGTAMSLILDTKKSPEDITETELKEIAEFATAAASLSTLRRGGISAAATPQEVRDFLAINK